MNTKKTQFVLILFLTCLLICVGCTRIKQGELVGVYITSGLDEKYYQDLLVFKLENGEEIQAMCLKKILPVEGGTIIIPGGKIFQLKYNSLSKKWKVKKILN